MEMNKKELIRKESLKFLKWNDANGCFTDIDCKRAEQKAFTFEESQVMLWHTLFSNDEFFAGCENALEIGYDEAIKHLKENSLQSKIASSLDLIFLNKIDSSKYWEIIEECVGKCTIKKAL